MDLYEKVRAEEERFEQIAGPLFQFLSELHQHCPLACSDEDLEFAIAHWKDVLAVEQSDPTHLGQAMLFALENEKLVRLYRSLVI